MIMQGRILRTVTRDVSFCGSGEEVATSCEGKTQEGLQSCRYFLCPQREAQWEDVQCAGVPAEEVGMWLGHDIGHSG